MMIHNMVIQLKAGSKIEDPRNYGPREVEQLKQLLAAGSAAQPDPRREHFYEIEGAAETYYIHVSPLSGEVVLLAKWNHQPTGCCLSAEPVVA